MFNQEINLLEQIAEAKDVIKRKYDALRNERRNFDQTVNETFKPIIAPLSKLVTMEPMKIIPNQEKKKKKKLTSTPIRSEALGTPAMTSLSFDEEQDDKFTSARASQRVHFLEDSDTLGSSNQTITIEPHNDTQRSIIVEPYIKMFENKYSGLDKKFGVRKMVNGDFKFGNSIIEFTPNEIKVGDQIYTQTRGLLELLFKQVPDERVIQSDDHHNYKKIASDTYLLRKNFQPDRSFKDDSSPKFRDFLAPVKHFTGAGFKHKKFQIPKYMTVNKHQSKKEYIYWNSADELCERLKLLVAERSAGNNNHENEIQSILEELRESNIIY